MQLENRNPDESVNYTIEHPLKEFAWLVVGVLGSLFVATLLIGYFAGEIAARLPYRYEQALAGKFAAQFESGVEDERAKNIEQSLNSLAARLTAHMDLPEGMQIKVHYQDAPVVNAFATIGGNVVVYRGLLARMPDENTLAMVMAHEIAHAKLRHPVRSLSRGVAVGIVLSVLDIGMGHNLASRAIGNAGGLTLLKYSREQESAADAEALPAVVALYQHAGGAQDLFRLLEASGSGSEATRLTMLSTHPLSQNRIKALAELAGKRGWLKDGARTPLAAALAGK